MSPLFLNKNKNENLLNFDCLASDVFLLRV